MPARPAPAHWDLNRRGAEPTNGTMKSFACGSVVPGCTASFHADSEEGILEQVAHHARADHGLADVPAELVAQVRANIVAA